MLTSLRISNLAIFRAGDVPFGDGLNVVTGETGSGKSLVLHAICFLLGAKPRTHLLRSGADKLFVEGSFACSETNIELIRQVSGLGAVDFTVGEEIYLRRELVQEGRSRTFVNNVAVTQNTLRALGELLVEVHGQDEFRTQISEREQTGLLDAYAQAAQLAREVAQQHARWRDAVRELDQVKAQLLLRDEQSERLRYELADIDAVAPVESEEQALLEERVSLSRSEERFALSRTAIEQLQDDDISVLVKLAHARRALTALTEIDKRALEPLAGVNEAAVLIEDAALQLQGLAAGVESSGDRLAEVESRLAAIEALKRRYGRDIAAILVRRSELAQRLDVLDAGELAVAEGLRRAQALYTGYVDSARKLSKRRKQGAGALEKAIAKELAAVALEGARFSVQLEPVLDTHDDDGITVEATGASTQVQPGPGGLERVKFLFAANPGAKMLELCDTVSGGEMSRLALLLHVAAGAADSLDDRTLILDEVDVGVGGAAADAVGKKLRALALNRQLICVTHQPQIAKFADHHVSVRKHAGTHETVAELAVLDQDDRVVELARMIGGNAESVESKDAAKWMLAQAVAE